MAFKETDNQFWTIIGANFPGHAQQPEEAEWDVYHAALDHRIKRPGIGNSTEEDVHLAEQLERDYGLTTEQAFRAIELGRRRVDNDEE